MYTKVAGSTVDLLPSEGLTDRLRLRARRAAAQGPWAAPPPLGTSWRSERTLYNFQFRAAWAA